MLTLDLLPIGASGVIVEIRAEREVKERLEMLNLFSGGQVRLLKIGTFGSGFLVEADGIRVGLRKDIANRIFIEKCSERGLKR